MKKLALISAIAMSGLFYNTATAQFGLHIGIHLFPHRDIYASGPVIVTRADVNRDAIANLYGDDDEFYYLPDVGAYYSVNEQMYYYFDGRGWIAAAYLPGVYRDYDWRYARSFEVREARPYLRNDFYRSRYQGFDCDLAHNHDRFRDGFDFHYNRNAYNDQHRFDNSRGRNDQRFDNRGDDHRFDNRNDNDQRFNNNDNRFDNRNQGGFDKKENGDNRNNNHGDQQFDQNLNKGNDNGQQANNGRGKDKHDKQDRIAQNQKGYNGHNRF